MFPDATAGNSKSVYFNSTFLPEELKEIMLRQKQNTDELNHFQNLSSHWWNVQGPFAQLHAITPLRMAFIKEKVGIHFRRLENTPKPFQGLRILDVGCGGGILCEPLARLGADVTGIDPVAESIESAKNHAAAMELPIAYLSCSLESLPENLPLFDVIIASEIIEHVTDHRTFIKTCIAHLKPHGGMMVSTFNKTLKSYLLGIVAAEYVLQWAPQGTHSWDKFISPQDLSFYLSSLGLGNQDLAGIAYSLIRRKWDFSPSTDVNYFLWAGRTSKIL